MPRSTTLALAFFLSLSTTAADRCVGGPISRDEYDRQTAAMEHLRQSLAAEPEAVRKLELVTQTIRTERDPNFRRRLMDIANTLPPAEQVTFYTRLLADDPDAGLRSEAATALGRMGSEKSLDPLAKAAASDPTTLEIRGDVGGQSSARRAAIFAIAELTGRHPALAADAAKSLRALPEKYPLPDNQGLADARLQALYQITHDAELLKPFYDRLKSDRPRERENGVIAFRFLKLKEAPPEVVALMKDPELSVRQWASLVLGEIGDPTVAPVLMEIAADVKQDAGARCNAIHSLGTLKAPGTADRLETLLSDPDTRVQTSAAIALYEITGKKAPQFPPGYNADGPKGP
jgi:HEAT repeat protein